MTNGSNSRFDRIEKILKTMVRAPRERDEALAKARRERDEVMAKAQRERDIRSEKRHIHHERAISRIDARLTRFVKLGVQEARGQRRRMQALDEKITELAAAQLITEEKLQRFLSARRTNGNGT